MSLFNLLGRKLAVITIVIVLLSLIVGFSLDWKGFTVNLLAGVVGVFISFFIGIKILNKFLDAQRVQQWEKVRFLTYTAISNHLYDIIGEVAIYYEVPFSPKVEGGRDEPNSFVAATILELCSSLQNLPGANSSDNTLSDIAVELYKNIQWDLDQLTNVILPRVIQATNDQEVIDALVGFDRAKQSLHNAVIVQKKISIGGIFQEVIVLVKQAQVAYSVLANTTR